jgi:hypothetical protein
MSENKNRTRLYKRISDKIETCDLGCEHQIGVYTSVVVVQNGDTRVTDNGYEKKSVPLYTDQSGLVYVPWYPIDFYGQTHWTRDSDGTHWYRNYETWRNEIPIDLFGNRIDYLLENV